MTVTVEVRGLEQLKRVRKRQLIDSYENGIRKGTYWGIRTDIAERTLQLAEVPTRLDRMPSRLQEQLINWGYAVCDGQASVFALPDVHWV
jgi:hypothetical protein